MTRGEKFLIIILTIVVITLCAVSFAMGYNTKRTVVMKEVEHTIQESVQTGNPFIFESGRMGLIEKVHHAKNGKTIAYRVISFTWPEEK